MPRRRGSARPGERRISLGSFFALPLRVTLRPTGLARGGRLSPLLFLLAALLLASGCSSGAAVKSEEAIVPFRPWGILGAKIANTREGVVITEIMRGASAEQAQLREGDIVTGVSGVNDLRSEIVIDHIRSCLPGSTITISYTRKGIRSSVPVTVGEYPRDEQIWFMAQAAAKALDFDRALTLCRYFEQNIPPKSRYAAPVRELKASVTRQIASGE